MWDGNDNAPGVAMWEWTPDTEDLRPLAFALSNSQVRDNVALKRHTLIHVYACRTKSFPCLKVCLDKNAECYESGDLLYVFSAVSTDTSTVVVSILASETGEEVDQWTHTGFARDTPASVHVVDGQTVIVKGVQGDLLLLNLDSRNSHTVSVPDLKNDMLTPGESFSISLLDSSVIRFQSISTNFEVYSALKPISKYKIVSSKTKALFMLRSMTCCATKLCNTLSYALCMQLLDLLRAGS